MQENRDNPQPVPRRVNTIRSQPRQGAEPSMASADTDQPAHMPSASVMPEADQVLPATPDVREAKVQALRQAVENGTYHIAAEQIAEKMLRDVLQDEVL